IMKFKRLAMLGILLVSLSGSGVVTYAADGANHVYETDSSYDVSPWIKDDGTVETEFTYEEAPWIADDGTVDMKLARYFRIANAEEGGTDVNEFYFVARDGVKVYKEKDRDSDVIEEFDRNGIIYIHLAYEDGWAWSGEYQGYVPLADLSEYRVDVTEASDFYETAGYNVKAYKYKDISSEVVEEYESGDKVFINEIYSDGWAWSDEAQGYILVDSLSEECIGKSTDTVGDCDNSVTISVNGIEIKISSKKN
ncbi:MAG: hypothetical protein K2M91_09005, partial [Lachnospiraceae bacterium]|nr:hypothetical protein [Lachnospiraceae bacterium]